MGQRNTVQAHPPDHQVGGRRTTKTNTIGTVHKSQVIHKSGQHKNRETMIRLVSTNVSKYIRYPFIKDRMTMDQLCSLFTQLTNDVLQPLPITTVVTTTATGETVVTQTLVTGEPVNAQSVSATVSSASSDSLSPPQSSAKRSPEEISLYPFQVEPAERMIVRDAYILGDHYLPLVDYFQESQRIQCSRIGRISPWAAYRDPAINVQWITKYLGAILNKSITPSAFEKILTAVYKRQCDPWPASYTLWLLRKWKPKRILSFCTGWGSEMAALAAYDEHELFTAIDANSHLRKGWVKMVETYGHSDDVTSGRYDLHTGVAYEDVDLGDTMYDMVISSPPYFHGEAYSTDSTQGYLRYSTVDRWIHGFLRPSLEKSWKHLKVGGVMALMLNDTWTVNAAGERELVRITQPMHTIMDSFDGSTYIDTWAFKTSPWRYSYQPLCVWRKRSPAQTQ